MGKKDPTGRELDILRAIWQITERNDPKAQCTVREIQMQLGRNKIKLAPTTVQTLLTAMEAKRLVKHTKEDRKFIYSARYSYPKAAINILKRVFGVPFTALFRALVDTLKLEPGESSETFSRLLGSQKLKPEDLKEMEQIIASVRNQSNESQS